MSFYADAPWGSGGPGQVLAATAVITAAGLVGGRLTTHLLGEQAA